MQLLILPYVIAMTSFAYHTASASLATLHLSADQNQTVAQAVLLSPTNQTNLTDSEFWPIEGNYWLELDKTNIYMDLTYVHSVLARAYRSLEKQPADLKITGTFSITADRTSEPHNEGAFVYAAIPGGETTFGDAFMTVKGLSTWYQQEPLREQKVATYFYLAEQVIPGRGMIGHGALKRVWQPFPPPIGGNVSASQ